MYPNQLKRQSVWLLETTELCYAVCVQCACITTATALARTAFSSQPKGQVISEANFLLLIFSEKRNQLFFESCPSL